MSRSFTFIILALISFCIKADVVIKQQDMSLTSALSAIAQDMKVKLVDNIDTRKGRMLITQTLSGNGEDLLVKLSEVYDFDWYVYGGTLTVQSGQPYINYSYKPKNIKANSLVNELMFAFQTSATKKIKLVERGNSILLSGTRQFVNDALSYAQMVDKNQFLENGNKLEIVRINFNFLHVLDRNISSFGEEVVFPGALSLIESAITNIGQFQNISDGRVVEKAYRVKLSDGDKQRLDEDEKTAKVQALPGSNALLVRGTPEEITLAKRIAVLIDKKRNQLMFSLNVYDIAVDREENFGVDSSWLSGSRGIYDILTPPFTSTQNFFENFQALTKNGMAKAVYQTNLLILENQQASFGKKDTATIALISDREVQTQKIEADNSIYISGRLLPSGIVQANIEYIEEALDDDEDDLDDNRPPRVTSQSVTSEVYIKPNETVVLGGFDNTVTSTIVTGVPVLSSIPILGELFKNTKESKKKYKRFISVSFEEM